MRLVTLFALFTLPAFSADVTVSTFDSVQYFGNGGEVACNPAGTACVWATSQYQNAGFSSTSEIAGCLGGYAGGVFQCTPGTTTCLTCGNDASLFSYVLHNPSTVTKGQPHFEVSSGNYLFLWVSAQGLSGCAASPAPGEGKCGDTWYVQFSISGSTISLTGPATNVTKIASLGSSTNGVLFARTGGTNTAGYHLFMSYRFANATGGISSCQSGAWGIRVWPYTVPFTSLGTEISSAASPFQPIGSCSYLEMSGFYDTKSGEFTFQGTPTGTSGGGPPSPGKTTFTASTFSTRAPRT
jgi:hypothetical protein